ncbi:MAG: fused MFS/spermidine synthase [Candidatus Omnitrophica bacterium]|nr:fused MFS/spermidine synthase [Candidatus Omnitrophota bacterium]
MTANSSSQRFSVFLFSVTLFVSAFLLFSVQPMFAKMVLPLLGGAPNVWNTCLVFFQMTLLLGYCYAHVLASFKIRHQLWIHGLFLTLAFLALPVAIPQGAVPPTNTNPVPWLLRILLVGIGLPFFVVSTTSPLIQKWFSGIKHASSHDPYFLYAASNLGSLIALLSYPVWIEAAWALQTQSHYWGLVYILFFLLTLSCAFLLVHSQRRQIESPQETASLTNRPLTAKKRLFWILLAFVPSSLMLGVTTFITTDVAAVPLLWIIPLSLYLLSFIFVFAKRTWISPALMNWSFAFFVVPIFISFAAKAPAPAWLHILFFFTAAMICHKRLADDRPDPRHLTEFYLWISVGGALGGFFNALAAPVLFSDILEYPFVIILLCFLRPNLRQEKKRPFFLAQDFVAPVLIFLVVIAIKLVFYQLKITPSLTHMLTPANIVTVIFFYAVPALLCFVFRNRSARFGLCILAFFSAHLFLSQVGWFSKEKTLHQERSFFGVTTVIETPIYRILRHGTTVHGMQFLDPAKQREPLTYFHRKGPIGDIFKTAYGKGPLEKIAVVGLGAGTLASYAKEGQHWDFYEIDPVIQRIAADPAYFTYLSGSKAENEIILGDGRLEIAGAAEQSYDLIFLDVFSSDAIPVHILTKEAILLYLSKLKPEGMLALNISNRYLKLETVLSSLAKTLGLVCLVKYDIKSTLKIDESGKISSAWAVLTRRPESVQNLIHKEDWKQLTVYSKPAEWTDNYSNILSLYEWGILK